ncbi:uncharacterized protein [Oscarella lobularis]|uniref:uncharacterized protein n=1 Tax=Oscarella lobularis TaxID=121494 RepID=UPI0033130DEC
MELARVTFALLVFFAVFAASTKSVESAAPCCTPPVMRCDWDQAMAEISSLTPLLELNNLSMTMDFSRHLFTLNGTFRTAFRSLVVEETVMCNYSKNPGVCYVAVDGQCTKTLKPNLFFQNCLPPDAKPLGNVTFGSEFNCSAYEVAYRSTSNATGNYSFTGVVVLAGSMCFPFAEAILSSSVPPGGGLKNSTGQALLEIGFNSKALPASTVIEPPSQCKNLTSELNPQDSILYRVISSQPGFNYYTFLGDMLMARFF